MISGNVDSQLVYSTPLLVKILCHCFNALQRKCQCLRKSDVFWFCVVVHVHGEVRHFGTVRYRIHFWFILCKWYRNSLGYDLQKLLQKVYCHLFSWCTVYLWTMSSMWRYWTALTSWANSRLDLSSGRAPRSLTYSSRSPCPAISITITICTIDSQTEILSIRRKPAYFAFPVEAIWGRRPLALTPFNAHGRNFRGWPSFVFVTEFDTGPIFGKCTRSDPLKRWPDSTRPDWSREGQVAYDPTRPNTCCT